MAFVVVGTSALGYYSGADELEYSLAETIRWGGLTAALLPFTTGLLVVPGAVVGLGFGLVRPRSAAERPFAAVTALLIVLLPVQAGLIASGDWGRPFERYAFYVLPLVFLAFCSLAERSAVRVRFHMAAALGLGAVAVTIPPPSRSSRSRSTRRRSQPSRRPAAGRRWAMPQVSSRRPG